MSSYFTNPFAPNSQVPVFASSPLNPLPTNSFPIPSNLRRSSLVRSSPVTSPNHHPPDSSTSLVPPPTSNGSGGLQAGGITFTSPFAPGKPLPPGGGQQPSSRRGSLHTPNSRPPSRGSSQTRTTPDLSPSGAALPPAPQSRRGSLQSGSPLRSPAAATHQPFFSHTAPPPTTSTVPSTANFLKNNPTVDFSRRRSVDVGVLGLGTHRQNGVGSMSKRVRDAVGPDAGDKETGFVASKLKGGKDRMLGRHLASILAHSLALCADPPPVKDIALGSEGRILPAHVLDAIPASPSSSPSTSRNTSITESAFSTAPSITSTSPPPEPKSVAPPPRPPAPALTFPLLDEAKRFKLIGNLQSWSFNAMSYNSDELLSCVGIMFESVRNMAGVEFDLDRLRSLLLSLRSAYHARNGYHNFSHATDVTQACYSFLVRMGLAPPLYLLCEDDYDTHIGEARRKWRRNRAVEEGGMGELLRPMDVFALMVAAIGHDVGHPGLSNAYMVNARTPVAQVYDDKSVLENFHTVTLIHMLRRHQFDYLLGGDFGHLGAHATSFRKVVEASILATDMSRHFGFVNQLNDLGRRFGERRGLSSSTIDDDRLLLCSGLIKCADISNPTRPHRISRLWSTALLDEWAVQATIETEFGLPVSVMTIDPSDTRAQAKSQVGFIDLFAKPLFNAMAVVVDEFADFAEKLRDGRIAWEAISLQSEEPFLQPISPEWKLGVPPASKSASSPLATPSPSTTPRPTWPGQSTSPPVRIANSTASRGRSGVFRANVVAGEHRHARQQSDGSTSSAAESPISSSFPASASSAATSTFSEPEPLFSRSPRGAGFHHPDFQSSCGGACQTATATCETCSRRQDPGARRESLGRAGAGLLLSGDDDDMTGNLPDESAAWLPSWPFLPGVFSPTPPT